MRKRKPPRRLLCAVPGRFVHFWSKGGEFMDEAKKLVVLEQENEELKRELKELFKTLDQMNQSLNRMIDHYILCKTEKAG